MVVRLMFWILYSIKLLFELIVCFLKTFIEFSYNLRSIPRKLTKRNVRHYSFVLIKLFCLIILIRSVYELTTEYLCYPFIYKVIVSDNKYGFDFPAISVCTERHVFFDKHKVIDKYNLSEKYEKYIHQWMGGLNTDG